MGARQQGQEPLNMEAQESTVLGSHYQAMTSEDIEDLVRDSEL
jgi:hypothetical protein